MRWFRKAAAVCLALLLLTVAAPVMAQNDVQVFVNGAKLEAATANVEGRTLVPLRAIFEALGAEVTWDDATKTALATWDGGNMALPIGAKQATVNGNSVQLDVPAQLIDGKTMVPLRFVGESMGALVGWYGNSRLVTINKPAKAPASAVVTRTVDGDTVELTFADGRSESVRLIGVDTPETVHPTKGEQPGGKDASDYTKAALTGQTVMVELDVEERDRYGRLLGYVYTTDGAMFNAVLMDQGLAQVSTYPPNVRYVDVFTALQNGAREAQVGLWVDAPAESTPAGLKYDPFGADRNCSDFDTHAEAQAFFEAAGGPGKDPHKLDSDNDGIVCESLR